MSLASCHLRFQEPPPSPPPLGTGHKDKILLIHKRQIETEDKCEHEFLTMTVDRLSAELQTSSIPDPPKNTSLLCVMGEVLSE